MPDQPTLMFLEHLDSSVKTSYVGQVFNLLVKHICGGPDAISLKSVGTAFDS